FLGGLSNQVGLADAREELDQTVDSAGFGLTARYPIDVRETCQRLGSRIRIGCLRIVDEQHITLAAYLLHAVGQAREASESFLNCGSIDAQRDAGCDRAGGILRVMRAPQRTYSAQFGNRLRLAAAGTKYAALFGVIAIRQA